MNKPLIISILIFIAWACEYPSSPKKIARLPQVHQRIAIQPFGQLDPIYAKEAQKAIHNYYRFEVDILPTVQLPNFAKNTPILQKYHLTNYPLRYRADTLIAYLYRKIPKKYAHIIGLTNQLISCTNRDKNDKIQSPLWLNVDWQIFGLGYRPGKSSVVSMANFGIDTFDNERIKSRVRKVVCHEFGHNLGLDHCKDSLCFMRQVDLRFALQSLDRKPEKLCQKCRKILQKKKNLLL